MSQENVEIVHKAIDAFNRRDLDALAALSHEDLEFVSAVEAGGATYRGRDTWAEYFAVMDEAWADWHVEDLEVFDAGDDRTAAVFRMVGTGRNSGARAGATIGVAHWFRDGKLWRVHAYLDSAQALEAAGLRE